MLFLPVHRDEDANVESSSEMRTHGALVPNALKPRKALEDGFQDAIAIFEEPNPYTKAMYRKNEVLLLLFFFLILQYSFWFLKSFFVGVRRRERIAAGRAARA
jgi:hypothetical protein